MPIIEVLVGPIASGKSTYCKHVAKRGKIIINDDDIVLALHAGHYLEYREELKPLYKSIESHILHGAIMCGKSVVVDRGLSMSRKARARWIALAQTLDTPIHARLFTIDTPEVHATRRMKADSRGYTYHQWLDAAERHFKNYEKPTLEEGFDHVHFHRWEHEGGYYKIGDEDA